MRRFIFALPLILTACSATQVADTTLKVDAAIASAKEEIAMACWAAQTADVAFMTFVAPKADAAIVADVRKAMDVVNGICANPPSSAQEAVATILAAYRKATTATAVTGV